MAERPLYTLYKNLKAQNYDVPDDYNKFESALTRDGKSGADNRHAIYENLKAQNFDVPDTYERFYSALFVPRSRTSSRAKGGSVPMSAADRARYLSVTQSVLNTARQVNRASGNIRKTVERAKKFNANDGKVTIGFKNPLQNKNVQKNKFNYNRTTGKTGTYTTTDGVEFDNEYDASQHQNQLDKQGHQYINAVNTGEIPSVFDVRDKNGNYDLQENIGKNGTYLTEEGAQKQFDKKLADAYARKKEIEALIAEDNRQHGNPLFSYGASIGASNGRTAEQSDYSNKLATSLALVKQQIGALEAVKQYPTSSLGEDALKALDNTAFTANTWDFGLTDFATMGQMERIKTKMDNNIPLSGSDKMLLKSKLGADAATALEDENMGNVYRWTKIAGQSLPFMADFFLTGGYGGITKGISRGALKIAAKRGMGKVSAAILKNTGIVAGDVIGSYAMAGTEQAMKTGADIMQRHLGNLYQDEKGDYKFGTFDENGNLLHEGGESMGTALYKGLTSAMVENYTEKLFGHNYGIKNGALNFMEKHGMNASAEFFKNIGKSGWYTNSKKWMEKFGINGFAEEVMEEEIGIPLHALLDGEGKVSDLLDAKQQLDIIGGMAISVGSMYAMGAGSRPVKGVYNRAQYYRFRNKVNVADSDAQNLIGDNWADIKDKIDNATNEQMGGVLADILRQRDTMTKEQINAAVNYGVNLMKMRGYNIAKTAEMNAREITNEPTTPEEQHQSDIDNAYSEGHDADDADKHDIQIQQEDQMKTLAAALNISEQQLSGMSDEELESLTGQDDKLDQAIYDYQLSYARYQGVVDDAQDKVDLAAHQAEQRVDMYTDKSRGSVRNATIKASGGAEDYGVYIISGNIATHDDGSIDVSNSDDMILYFDPTTNSVEHADASMFAELGEELPADDVKAQAVADAKENAIKEIAGIIDGTVEVGSQFSVTDADGTEHTYEVLADNGDGTAMITIDGNVPTELVNGENVQIPYSFEDLQKMKDLEDQKRLEAAKAEREQIEKERAGQETQETEQTQPSFDFNQILNDDGNVVLVDVLDKDGNTKYPDSKLFLIRDAGAKAKVVELKSDGSIVPHAVKKEDVATISSMSLDEYKQAFAESSMIEDNSGENRGEIEAEPATIEDETTPEVAENTEITAPSDETAETPSTEQTPAITLEDGTIVPMLDDGNPDFSKLTAAQTAELYDTEFGEDADSIVSGYVSDAKKALDKANNMTVKGKTFVEQKASKDAKEKAIADAQAAYDSAIAIRDAYNERQLAKVEDTADGRKNLIEKARRKFARLKSSVKDDAEAVAQIYKDTVGSLLHRLYDGTGIDVTDTIPLTAEEYVASNLGAHSLNYEGTETSKSVKQETGLSREDFAKTQLLAADGKGTTIDALVHSLWENRPSNLDSLDTQDIRNALIGVLTSGFKASEARSFIENIRIAQAEKLIEEERTAAENAAYYEQQKAKEEEEKKKAELEKKAEEEKEKAELDGEETNPLAERVTETDDEVESDGKYGTIYNKVYLIDGDKRVTKVDEPDANGNYTGSYYMYDGNRFGDLFEVADYIDGKAEEKKFPDKLKDGSESIEVPEDATDEKPFGKQLDESDLPFSAKENGTQQTTDERAADVEKNKVDDMKVVDNIVGDKTRKAFERLAKMMGANVQWQYSDKLGNGWIQETTDADGNVNRTIYITLDSSITEGAQFIFGHEMTHQIKNLNPAAYNELTQLVLDTYGSDAFDKAVDETMKRYSDAGFSGRSRDYYAEEVVADSVGEMIRDLNLAHTLAMKMSHPLLAAIHEILQKIKLAFFGTEYSDATKNIIRSIEQAYVKTAKGEVTNSETGEDVSFSLRQKPEPKKKGIGYKVFVLKDGKLYPPMVANPDGAATPVGVWLDADAAPIAGESKTGRPQVKQGGKGTQGGSGKLAYRPGWHLGVVPYAIQFNRKDAEGNKTLFPKNFVFAEVEYAADVDYQEEARQEGINPSGKYQHSLAGLKHLPTDGYYMYRTNPNPETDPWVITGAMKVNRILTRAEQAELVKKAGREPQQIQEGDIVTDDVVNSINQEIAAAPKFSLKVYHGSGADFTEFDFDHMGEGAGSQVFGWGGYVTSSKKIGKDYASIKYDPDKDVEYVGKNKKTFTDLIATLFDGGIRDYNYVKNILLEMSDNDKSNISKKEEYDWFVSTKPEDWFNPNPTTNRNLYEVDIPDDNGSNYLEWEKTLNEEQINSIRDALIKNGVDVSSWEKRGFKLDLPFKNVYTAVLPMMMRCEPKEVSKFLSSLGFTGIKYPAGTIMGGAEKGDTNYVIFKPDDMKITEHTKFSIKTYHGSQASFDHFDHSFMGSGEGAQAYGWGTYVSEVEGIAKAYAKQNASFGRIYKISKYLGNGKSVVNAMLNPSTHKKTLLRLIDNAIRTNEAIQNSTTFKPMLEEAKKALSELKTAKEILEGKTDRNLYSVDIPDDTGYNYIGWDEPLTDKQVEMWKNAANSLAPKDDDGSWKERVDYYARRYGYNFRGEKAYKILTSERTPKEVSLALKDAGFVGVKVIAHRNTGGNKEGKMNYVIFDENNAQITSHTKFSLRLKSAIEETETNPSDAQKESGNYKKGHIKFGGYDYTIENPKGSTRSGKDANGKEWKVTMHDTYGYIRGKFGKDGDHLDMFINDKADLDSWNGDVFVVDQVNPDGSFDEHKVMYGYDSMDDAEKAYLANYSKGWQGLGNITGASKAEFDNWLDTSNRKLKPFADYAKVKFSQAQSVNNDEPKTFEEFLNHPSLKFSIKNEEQRKAAENAYKYASELRPNKHAKYAIVDMSNPSNSPEYYEKKVLADRWRRFYNKAVHNELDDVYKDAWGNYKLFDLDRPFADQVNEVKGDVPSEFDAPDKVTNKDNIKGLDIQVSSAAEPRYSLKDEKTMFGMHNISLDKLRKAIKQGGFAAPSMGVVDSKNGIYSDYGEITLIPKAEKLAKRTGKNAGTFTADAWTPVYPKVERIMNKQGEKAFNTDMNVKLGDVDNGIYSNVRESWKGYLSSGDVRDGLYWHYLFDKGMNPETIYQTGKYDNDITNEVMRISDNGYKTDYTDKEVAELIQLMNKATGKDNDVDAQREKLKARIASAEKQGNHLLVALKKKRLEELEGVENFYIAADFVNDVVRNNRKNGKVDVHDTMGAAKKKVEDNKKLSDDFPSWLDKKTEEYGVEEMLYNGTTPTGKSKYIPNTIENAVKLMKKQGLVGGYNTFHPGVGAFIAKLSPQVNTLAAMKKENDKLIPFGDERHNEVRDKILKEYRELARDLQIGESAWDDSGEDRMQELAEVKPIDLKGYIKRNWKKEVSDDWVERYNDLVNTIKNGYPVYYFETKFMRPYGLDEFEKAIVPNDTPSDVVDALNMAGIDVSSYERGNAEDRQKVTMDAINSSDNIRFSLKAEKEKIVADAKANGTYMTAPNGEKTKLDAEQWATVRTTNFKNWFGDWENDPENASKVVDENGEPMVMYHYTDESFTIFGKDKEVGKNTFGNATNASYAATTTIGHWFTSNKKQPEYMGKPIACFLNIVEPFDGYTLEGLADYLNNYISDEDFNSYEEDYENVAPIIEAGNNFREEQIRDGYDGVVIDDEEFGGTSYVAFDANQIKSAESNNGNFSADNDDIRFSLRYDKFEHDLNQWKKDNNLPKEAQRPTIPQRNVGESAVDFLRRVDEYRKQMALWKTAPTYEQHLLSDDTALGEFNRELQRGSVLKRIAFQDSMLAIRKAQEAIMKEVGIDRLNMAEDAYTAENRSHGKGKNEFEEYNNEFLQPLRKAYHQMKKVLGDSYDNVRLYMMAKHGLERNAQMAFKKSLEADYEDVAQRIAAYKAYKGDINRMGNDSGFELGLIDYATWVRTDNAIKMKYSPSYINYRYDKMGITFDYSGISALFDGSDFEEAAHKLVRDVESKHIVETKELWDATNAATKKILRDGYKAGMMSKDTYQYVRDMYSHYIPLRGWDGTTADQVWDYVGGGKGAFNQTLKTAHGRTSIADDPIAYIENMAESGILLNNKNWVKQHLMLLAQNHPTSLLTLSKAWYVKSTDSNGNEEWIPATPQITSQMNSNQVKAAIDAFEQKMEQMEQTGDATQKRDGLNIAYPQTHSEEREHEVRVMKDGEEYVIYVNGDPQLAQAMNNTRAHRVREIQSGKLDRAAAWIGRKMAAAYTSLSPLFIPSNYFRDLTMTLASTAIREDAKYNYLLRKNLATSWNLGFMLRDYQNGKLREKVNNGNATPKEQMFYDFMMNGGETGFVSSLDVEDLKKKFKNDLKDLNRWKANPVKVGHTIMDIIEFLNRMIEDSNRFAVYMTSIQYGRSIDEAVNDAKDVTLNFNRKGTGEYGWQMIRNLYLFINPAVQSLQTLGALAKHHPFKFTAVTASWLASGVLVPIVNAALMQMASAFGGGDGDDDKEWYKDISKKYWQFSKWDRRNNLIMWVPFTHEFIKIPLAQEFRAFYGVGDMIASKMMGGELVEESWSQYAEDLLGQVVDMLPLDPTGYDGNIAVSMMPNAIRPVFELAFNVDFTGKPLFKDTEYNKYDPNFTKAYVGTPDWLVRVSKMVNSIGNDYPDVQQNSIDAFGNPRYNLNNPAVVDHVLSSYLGGAYTMGSQVLGLLTKSLNDPNEINVADIPLFSKFVSNPDDRPVTKKQGDEFWNMKENHDRVANTLSKLKKQANVDGDYSMLERFYGSEEYKQYKQDDVKVKKYEEDKKKERAEESGEEYRPHKLNAEDIYKAHATPKDDFEDLKLKQLYIKLNGFKTSYDLLVDTAPSQSDGYYNTNKAAIDAIDEISLDKQEISELKKGFLDDGKDAYNDEDMKQIRELRKKILSVLEKANKVIVANQKANAKKK